MWHRSEVGHPIRQNSLLSASFFFPFDGHWQSQWKKCVWSQLWDSEVIGQQIVPNVARVVKEAKVRMARDGTRKASRAKGKLMMTKEKAKVASGKHARHLKGIAITFGNGVTWKRIVSQKPRSRGGKGKKCWQPR